MRLLIGISALAVAGVSSLPAQAQDNDVTDLTVDGPTIVVTGERERRAQQIQNFAKDLTRRPRIDKPLARFAGEVCPVVIGMTPPYAQFIVDRVKTRSREAGLRTGDSGCQPNMLIAFVPDPDAAVRQLKEEDHWAFNSLLSYQIDRVFNEPGPARSWQYVETLDERGAPMAYDRSLGTNGASTNRVTGTRLRLKNQMASRGSILVVGGDALNGRSLGQIGDYAAMRLLTDITPPAPDETPQFETIMSLFNGSFAPKELSLFDRTYLRVLYNYPATWNAPQIYQQVGLNMVTAEASREAAEQEAAAGAPQKEQEEEDGELLPLRDSALAWVAENYGDGVGTTYGESDLDGDGTMEALVYLDGPTVCGSGGCNLVVLRRASSGFQVLGRTTVTRLPLGVLESSTGTMRDLWVTVGGGGLPTGYRKLTWQGTAYPSNPTVAPAETIDQMGETIIAADKPAG
ncbi:hypothetical protein MKP08_08555 [Erythrobacter sp. LQ02-29]|uniref:hypothetical protein n=1 Tax=Erythrobacter sp. LQ02-29 TaxID=2920384 RepID=UPI001F4E24F8|nr:hypothetical protein [Erythrobacter sp. LQ02-29]MCP9222795.1 hypothetical protein [Erythrobacter sp. LQ02-29]